MNCSQCNGPTTEKQIVGKFGPTKVYECTSGCKNAKGYPLGTFPPRGNKNATPPGARPPAEPSKQDEILRCLLRIEKILDGIDRSMSKGGTHISQAEMKPDEDIPF
jgi:hypothetical protein